MILYHFTGQAAVDQMCTEDDAGNLTFVNGLKRGADSMREWEGVLGNVPPHAVWLTTDSNARMFRQSDDAPDTVCFYRITLAIPSTDRRLVNWVQHIRKRCTAPEHVWRNIDSQPAVHKFFVYFGDIPLGRFRSAEVVEQSALKDLASLVDREAA